jgi:hypothetical protein
MARNLHISRTIDMMFGAYISDKNGPIENISKEFQSLIDEVNTSGRRYRDILTQNTPAVYVVNCDDVAATLVAELSKNKSTRQFGSSQDLAAAMGGIPRLKEFIKPDGIDPVSALVSEPGFQTELAEYLFKAFSTGGSVLTKTSKTTQSFFGATVATEYSPTSKYKAIPQGNLSDIYNKVSSLYVKYRGSVASEMRGSKSYTRIQALGIRLGKDLRDTLQNTSNFIVKDANKYIKLPTNRSLAVCGASFDGVVASVNRVLDNAFRYFIYLKNKDLLLYFKTYEDRTDKDKKFFSIGYIINAGHTSISALSASGKRSIGVNMPSAQEAQVTMPRALAEELESELSNLYVNIGYDIEFKKNLAAAKSLLELNFAFVITMPSALNTKSLNVAEQQIIRSYTKDIQKTLQNFVGNKKVLDIASEYLYISNSSPSLLDNIQSSFLSILKGEKPSVKPSNYSKPGSLTSGNRLPNKSSKLNKQKRTQKQVSKTPVNKVPAVRLSTSSIMSENSLTSLLSLINNQLQDVISANMGDGDSRRVLNYRTGRLAASAKVEKLSESRTGLITAFYSYMKNPYATFSDGGRQQNPKSRDPKLLISKSIREIAATQVGNRLRAVNV